MKNGSFHQRLGYALAGLRTCWRTEANFRIQARIAVGVFVAMGALGPAPIWWGLITLVIVLVLGLELLNSALERLIDHLHPELHPEIGMVKDMAAGAVLMISIGALAIAAALIVSLV